MVQILKITLISLLLSLGAGAQVLRVANGGTGAATATSYKVFGNCTGSTAAPSFCAVTANMLPDLSGTYLAASSFTRAAVVALWTTCSSGYLKYDGTCDTPTGSATVTRVCELHIWGTGAAGVLQDTDDEAASCYNGFGVTETITAVACWANAGSPTVTPVVNGGGTILASALTCGTASWATGSLSGTPTLTSGSSIDGNITAAGGTATNLRVAITLTR